jgi:multidrug efflux pump subunit AcrB
MSFVAGVLKRPYTVIAALILILILGAGSVSRMPVDIFPEIDIPVVSVVWTYNGMKAQNIQNRILSLHERQLASLVDDIARIEATSYYGVGVEKIYLHEGADVTRAISQLASSALVVLKYMPPNITPPLVIRYGATDVPIILALVINFQSWIDPLIVLAAVPFALGGVMWMLFLTQTHLSIPALMGALMCIGLTTANSILVVTFANQRMEAGDTARQAATAAGYTRLRPVLMTAGAMIIGMIPMALDVGEGGEQNAPLARAVIGGLAFATFAALIFVPAMYGLLRKGRKDLFGEPVVMEHAEAV